MNEPKLLPELIVVARKSDRLTAQGIDQTAVGDNLAPGPAARFVEDHLRPKIIWHDAPPVIIEDDEPQIGRD